MEVHDNLFQVIAALTNIEANTTSNNAMTSLKPSPDVPIVWAENRTKATASAVKMLRMILNNFMLFASDGLNSESSANLIASLPRALDSGIARASLDATDYRALFVLDYIFGHSHPRLLM